LLKTFIIDIFDPPKILYKHAKNGRLKIAFSTFILLLFDLKKSAAEAHQTLSMVSQLPVFVITI